MFWRLGFTNAWRNIARSALALLSMAIAAGFLTYSISLSRGYPSRFREDYRSLLGGDIVFYDRLLSLNISQVDQQWQYQRLHGAERTDLAIMMPELAEWGYMTTDSQNVVLSSELLHSMAELETISAVYPRYQLPASSLGHSSQWETPLRGRDLALDQLLSLHPRALIGDGRWFSATDEGEMVAIVSSQQGYPLGQRKTGVGDLLTVLVPRIVNNGHSVFYNFNDPIRVSLRVIGVVDVRTRSVPVSSHEASTAQDPQQAAVPEVQLYAQNNEIQLPLETWKKIWHLAGGAEYYPQQASIIVDDMSYLEDSLQILRQAYPQLSFFSASQLLTRAEERFLLEDPAKLTLHTELSDRLVSRYAVQQPAEAMDMTLAVTMLIFINAAMVIASNLLIMVSEREAEVGILKAVGAQRRHVLSMVLSEALLISCLGAVAGFVIFRVPALFNQLSNGVAPSVILWGFGRDFTVVLGAAGLSTLVFGMLPAIAMARLSVREVLQRQ